MNLSRIISEINGDCGGNSDFFICRI